MSRPKFHKVYFPGLISLVGLPLACIVYICTNFFFNTYGIEVQWVNDSIIKSWTNLQKQPFNINSFRKFDYSILTGNEKTDNRVLNVFKKNVAALEQSEDTVKAYALTFTDYTRYEEIVESIDICAQYKGKDVNFALNKNRILYILYKNKILVWKGDEYKPPAPPPEITL